MLCFSTSTRLGSSRHPICCYKLLFAFPPVNPCPSSHWRIILFTSSGFCVNAQCVAGTSPLVRFGISASILRDISGLSTESYVAWMKRIGCLRTFLSSKAWSSSQLVRRWRYQFTRRWVSWVKKQAGEWHTCRVNTVLAVFSDVVFQDLQCLSTPLRSVV